MKCRFITIKLRGVRISSCQSAAKMGHAQKRTTPRSHRNIRHYLTIYAPGWSVSRRRLTASMAYWIEPRFKPSASGAPLERKVRGEAMTKDKKAKCYEVLDLMTRNEVSIKDLSFVIAEFSLEGGLKETQQKIKGFLYADKNIIEPDTPNGPRLMAGPRIWRF